MMGKSIADGEIGFSEWQTKHGAHGRGGPFREVVIGNYEHHRCPCGDRIIVERPQ